MTCSTSETDSEQTYCNQGVVKETRYECKHYLEYVMRLGAVGPEGKDGREAVEEMQGGEGERYAPPPVSSLSW